MQPRGVTDARGDRLSKAPKNHLRGNITIGRPLTVAFVAFSYPDFTVGPGVSPDPAQTALAGFTADRELDYCPHPAPKAWFSVVMLIIVRIRRKSAPTRPSIWSGKQVGKERLHLPVHEPEKLTTLEVGIKGSADQGRCERNSRFPTLSGGPVHKDLSPAQRGCQPAHIR
jgi:hypothetical protein